MQRHWKPISDMNGDGFITISDVSAWIGWLFYYPGDFFIYVIGSDRGLGLAFIRLARFFETTPPQYGGWISFFISLAAWVVLLIVIGWIAMFVEWLTKHETEIDET